MSVLLLLLPLFWCPKPTISSWHVVSVCMPFPQGGFFVRFLFKSIPLFAPFTFYVLPDMCNVGTGAGILGAVCFKQGIFPYLLIQIHYHWSGHVYRAKCTSLRATHLAEILKTGKLMAHTKIPATCTFQLIPTKILVFLNIRQQRF